MESPRCSRGFSVERRCPSVATRRSHPLSACRSEVETTFSAEIRVRARLVGQLIDCRPDRHFVNKPASTPSLLDLGYRGGPKGTSHHPEVQVAASRLVAILCDLLAMDSHATANSARPGHARSRSAGLKSLVMPSARTPSSSPSKASPTKNRFRAFRGDGDFSKPSSHQSSTEDDHSSALSTQPILGERSYNQPSPSKSPQKSLLREDRSKSKPLRRPNERSATSPPKDKENTTPPATAVSENYAPIWAQFATQHNPALTELDSSSSAPHAPLKMPVNSNMKDFASPQTSVPGRQLSIPLGDASDRNNDLSSLNPTAINKASQVSATIAKLNSRNQPSSKAVVSNQKDIDAAFEAVLVRLPLCSIYQMLINLVTP